MTDSKVIAPEQPERLDLRSEDIAAARREELLRLFPETRTEGGQIDFAQLQRALGETIDPGKERYGLTWPGKADCFKTIQAPSLGTLLPSKAESVDWDTTENLILEGDNLEVLKLLQKSYLGKVKMIYIDPPYNTGNDFIYPDDYAESLKTYLEYTGQADEAGRRFSTNTDTDGRFHSKWLNMMYPRLYLARNLLRDDGVIFMTIGDTEAANLRHQANEIFGEENFLASVIWQKKYAVSNDDPGIATMHDYVLVYRRSAAFQRNLLPRTERQTSRYANPDNDPRGPWSSDNYVSNKSKEERPTLWYPIRHPRTGEEVWPETSAVWRYARDKHRQIEDEGRLYWGPNQSYRRPRLKRYLNEVQPGVVPSTWWPFSEVGHNDEAQKETAAIIGPKVFSTPKPIRLLRRMIEIGAGSHDIILDFFAGSGATGQAVLEANADDGGKRKFILVQLPEPTDREDYASIADIAKERVRRVIVKLDTEDWNSSLPQDRGFKVFKLAGSNIAAWEGGISHDEATLAKQLELHIDHIRDDRAADDVLYEILLKSGFPLSTRVESVEIEGRAVTSVAEGALLICLDQALSLELVRAIAARKPERAVFLDEGFAGNDALKANAAQVFKAAGVTFRTV